VFGVVAAILEISTRPTGLNENVVLISIALAQASITPLLAVAFAVVQAAHSPKLS
jgi:hypothetical protein